MLSTIFEGLLSEVLDDIKQLYKEKRSEYAKTEDIFYNFKEQALFNKNSPLESLRGNWSKHIISIRDMLDKISKRNNISEVEFFTLQEKLYDNILYSILCYGMLSEMMDDSEKGKDQKI